MGDRLVDAISLLRVMRKERRKKTRYLDKIKDDLVFFVCTHRKGSELTSEVIMWSLIFSTT